MNEQQRLERDDIAKLIYVACMENASGFGGKNREEIIAIATPALDICFAFADAFVLYKKQRSENDEL